MKSETAYTKFVPPLVTLPLLLLSFPAGRLEAQVVGGTISGAVSDKSSAVVANATVSVKNLATGVATSVQTNVQGLYSIPNLIPGNYQQTVSADGFDTSI